MAKWYIFTGRVLPEREAIGEIHTEKMHVTQEVWNLDFDIKISISKSQISALVNIASETIDILTLRNTVAETIRMVVDSCGYLLGQGYEVDIVSVTDENNTHIVFDVSIGALATNSVNLPERFDRLARLAGGSPYLQWALTNLGDAIKRPRDTGFHCYRAIENVRQAFVESQDKSEEAKSWDTMNSALKIKKEFSMYLLEYSKPQRHGWTKPMTESIRVELMRRARQIVDRYCIYLERGKLPLNETEFPFLKAEDNIA